MASGNAQASGGGIGCCTVVLIVFVILKLTGNIDWSWWWVTAPLWGPIALVLAVLALVMVVGGAVAILAKR
jgi:Ca2+/H+ antiporter